MSASWIQQLPQHRAIAVIRSPCREVGLQMAKAVAAGGIRSIEITWNSDDPAELVATLRTALPQCAIGVGTVLTVNALQEAIAAGAQFLFSPHTDEALIDAARDRAIPIVPGALSPSEIVRAWQAGASSVKVFPIQAVGGERYIRSLQGPLGDIPLIPTGGVTLENAAAFLAAGAIAVGLSSQLFPSEAIQGRHWETVTERARHLMQRLSENGNGISA